MPTDASAGRQGSVGFFGRAFSGKGGRDGRRESSFLASQWHAGLGEGVADEPAKEVKDWRRPASTAPLPPSLAPCSPPPPAADDKHPAQPPCKAGRETLEFPSQTKPPTLPRKVSFEDRLPRPRSNSSTEQTAEATKLSETSRRRWLFDPEKPPFPSSGTSRSRETSASSAVSSSTTDAPISSSTTAQRRLSTSSMRYGRPISSIFPSRRPSTDSCVSGLEVPDTQPTRERPLREQMSGSSLSRRDAPAVLAEEDEEGGKTPVIPSLGTPKVGSAQMDALVDGLQKRSGGMERRGRPRSPSHAGDASGWKMGGTGSASPIADARTPVDLFSPGATPALAPYDDTSAFERAKRRLDQSGAPDAIRQESLRAVERRPWMVVQPDGSVRTDLEIVEAYREKVGARRKSSVSPGAEERRAHAKSPLSPATATDDALSVPPPLPPKSPPRPLKLSPPPRKDPSPTNRQASLPYVPFPSSPIAATSADSHSRAKTIEEIIAEHAPTSYLDKRKSLAVPSSPSPSPTPPARSNTIDAELPRALDKKDSVDSLAAEIEAAGLAHAKLVQAEAEDSRTPRAPQIANGFHESASGAVYDAFPTNDRSFTPASTASTADSPYNARIASPQPVTESETLATERELARLLKSPRLTRIITLRQPPNAGLSVSIADVGDPSGHPVLVFLGLGSVRYLVALYDEIAEALGLRLLCFDRWGLGKTSDISDSQRGFVEWASVVAELVSANHLNLSTFSILAHSAGAPYAVASSLHPSISPKVRGSLHLLAPWVSSSADSLAGAYKYLRYVPSSVLRTAQAAEWKVHGWRLGAPPTLVHSPVGYDARSGRMVEEAEGRVPVSPRESPGLLSPDGQLVTRRGSKGVMGGLGGLFSGGDRGSPSRARTLDSPLPTSDRRSSLRPVSFFGRRTSDIGSSPKSPTSGGLAPPSPSTPVRRHSFFSSPKSTLSPPATPLRPDSPSPHSLRPLSPHSPTHASFTASTSSLASRTTPSPALSDSPRPAIPPAALIDGLLRASHAESLRGSTADLLVLLERTSPSSASSSSSLPGQGQLGFSYADVPHRMKVWYGEKDDRISEASVRWLQREVEGRCEVRVVQGAGHGLMTNSKVMLEVLESIAAEARTTP
ncbi:RHTO0S02e10484g1_1 [Rhodotorula toruloides]|uniref:RHTO0S02e10484g1_1 n=2 Tax=Rhodotorula toruloides TaxID=5286 RepID=A0A061AHQ3_RHOTO|nr:RHTO0S02e10484g1_1 [Rhodotorula toruloides]